MTLKAKNVSMSFEKKLVLDDVSMDLNPGEIVALIGRNGSGKTTFLKNLSQIYEPTAGQVELKGQAINKHPNLKQELAYLPDNFNFFPYDKALSIMDYYEILYDNFDKDFVINEMEALNIPLNVNLRNLSKGQKTLLGLVIVIATGASYLLIDEVLDGMDVLNKELIIQYLIDASLDGKGILVSSHQLADLEVIADRIVYLSLEGKMDEVVNKKTGHEFEILKYQIVVQDDLAEEIRTKAVIRSSVARVHTILVTGSKEEWEALFKHLGIVQYDLIPTQVEDLFYYERGGEEDAGC